ncbi:hypothetical protein [Bernardetia sp.]|uniref:hypothetical protein n=1 Tax=Bernardetia sp. TaxID=1937974 RepID=UPI0025C4CB73|nr:hypothetical protein [Bernardetia sp.]
MTAKEAEEIVTKDLEAESDVFAVIPNSILESEKCFAVFYQTKKYIETGSFEHFAIGQGAVLVDKITKKIYHTGSGRPAESYIKSYELYGDPFLEEDKSRLNVELEDSSLGSRLMQIQLIKAVTKLGVSDAKKVFENLMRGGSVIILNEITDEQRNQLIENGFKLSYPLN